MSGAFPKGHRGVTPVWTSLFLSSGMHLMALIFILFLPFWGHHKVPQPSRAIWVNLVEIPSLPKGTGSVMPAAAPSPPPIAAKKPVAPVPPRVPKEMKAKESKIPDRVPPPDTPKPQRVLPPSPPPKMPEPLKMPEPSTPKVSPKAPSVPIVTAPSFTLPPLPSITSRKETARLPGDGAGESKSPGRDLSQSSISVIPKGNVPDGGFEGGSEKRAGILGIPSSLPGVSVDNPDFQFTYYLVIIQNKISSNWLPSFTAGKGGEGKRAIIAFRIMRNGQVRDLRVETPSGLSILDQSALRAISRSNPLPPLPQRFLDDSLGVHFSFELQGEKG